MTIRLRLAELTASSGLTLQELSRRTGVSRVNLSRLRAGHADGIRFSTLDALCEALACSPGDLFQRGAAAPGSDDEVPRDAHSQAALEAIQAGALTVDQVVEVTGLRTQDAVVACMGLELAGLVRRVPGGLRPA